jgi:hypothetical protein
LSVKKKIPQNLLQGFKAVAAIVDSVSQKPGGYAENRFPEPGSGSILRGSLTESWGLATVLVCWLDQ